ncbi:hypothetical protein RB596_007192 [Gaeumannomyces avenae]
MPDPQNQPANAQGPHAPALDATLGRRETGALRSPELDRDPGTPKRPRPPLAALDPNLSPAYNSQALSKPAAQPGSFMGHHQRHGSQSPAVSPMGDTSPPLILGPEPAAAPPTSPNSPQATAPSSAISRALAEEHDHEASHQAETGIVADEDEVSAPISVHSDGGYDSEGGSGSESMSSSIMDFVYENGRRYHRFREGQYNFPNDKVEQEREILKHVMIKLLCGKLYYAPIGDSPQNILDVGTGTGIWAIEVADQLPSSIILGIDLSPIQPEYVPPNVRFMVDDVESEWLHPPNHFDYVHFRHTVMAIKNWRRVLEQAFHHIRPGGWIEIQEFTHYPCSSNNTMLQDNPLAQFFLLLDRGLGMMGIDFLQPPRQLADKARDCGFVNVTEKVLQVPIGTWPRNKTLKTIGLYWRSNLFNGLQAIAMGPLTRGCGWTAAQVEVFLVEVRRAIMDNSCQFYMPFHIICAQKPAMPF